MPGPIGIFAAYVLARLGHAVLIGERLGSSFSNIAFINALRGTFPELSISQVGRLASAAIFAAQAGVQLTGIAPPGSIAPGDVPVLAGLREQLKPGNQFLFRFRFGYIPSAGSAMAFTSATFEFSSLVGTDILSAAALATLKQRIIDSPEAFGFQSPGEVEIETLFVQYVIQGV